MRVTWSEPATRDLHHIADYIAERNPAASQRVVRTIIESCGSLSLFPYRGRPSRMKGKREFVFSPLPYIAVYNIHDTHVEILRIYHTAQDWP
jgi:toxin ParE1/3/4